MPAPMPGEAARQRRGDGEVVEDEARGIVDQALALEDHDETARNAHLLEHRGRGDRIRGRDDRAECEADGPGKPRHQEVGGDADERGREPDEADGQQQDRGEIGPEGAPGHEEGRGLQERWQEEDEHEGRLDRHLRQEGNEGERHAAEHERDGVGEVIAPRDQRKRDRGREQPQHGLENRHAASVTGQAARMLPRRQWLKRRVPPSTWMTWPVM